MWMQIFLHSTSYQIKRLEFSSIGLYIYIRTLISTRTPSPLIFWLRYTLSFWSPVHISFPSFLINMMSFETICQTMVIMSSARPTQSLQSMNLLNTVNIQLSWIYMFSIQTPTKIQLLRPNLIQVSDTLTHQTHRWQGSLCEYGNIHFDVGMYVTEFAPVIAYTINSIPNCTENDTTETILQSDYISSHRNVFSGGYYHQITVSYPLLDDKIVPLFPDYNQDLSLYYIRILEEFWDPQKHYFWNKTTKNNQNKFSLHHILLYFIVGVLCS